MRFCSLKTLRWSCCQGSVSHLSIGAAATVVIASPLLLPPLPSTSPGLRQPIPWLSHRPLLLSPSFSSPHAADTCSAPRVQRAKEELLRSWTLFAVAGGVSLFAGRCAGMQPGARRQCPAGEEDLLSYLHVLFGPSP